MEKTAVSSTMKEITVPAPAKLPKTATVKTDPLVSSRPTEIMEKVAIPAPAELPTTTTLHEKDLPAPPSPSPSPSSPLRPTTPGPGAGRPSKLSQLKRLIHFDVPGKEYLLGYLATASLLLGLVSLLAIVFLAVSGSAYNGTGEYRYVGISLPTVVNGTDRGVQDLTIRRYELQRNVRTYQSFELVGASSGLSLVLALVAFTLVVRAMRGGPHYLTRTQRALAYVPFHLGYLLPLASWIYLTIRHQRSGRYSFLARTTTEPSSVFNIWTGDDLGMVQIDGCPRDRRCDLDTWACALYDYPGYADRDYEMDRMCVGQQGSRVLTLGMGLVVVLMVVVMELDRRGPRALWESWRVRAREEAELDDDDGADEWGMVPQALR